MLEYSRVHNPPNLKQSKTSNGKILESSFKIQYEQPTNRKMNTIQAVMVSSHVVHESIQSLGLLNPLYS